MKRQRSRTVLIASDSPLHSNGSLAPRATNEDISITKVKECLLTIFNAKDKTTEMETYYQELIAPFNNCLATCAEYLVENLGAFDEKAFHFTLYKLAENNIGAANNLLKLYASNNISLSALQWTTLVTRYEAAGFYSTFLNILKLKNQTIVSLCADPQAAKLLFYNTAIATKLTAFEVAQALNNYLKDKAKSLPTIATSSLYQELARNFLAKTSDFQVFSNLAKDEKALQIIQRNKGLDNCFNLECNKGFPKETDLSQLCKPAITERGYRSLSKK